MKRKGLLLFRKSKTNKYTLAVLLGALEDHQEIKNWHVEFFTDPTKIFLRLSNFNPIVIGYSFMTPDLDWVKSEIKYLKKKFNKDVILISGGPHASGNPIQTLNLGFKYIFIGEAESTLIEFLKNLRSGNEPDSIIIKPDKHISVSCLKPISYKFGLFAPFEITRGCPWACNYCQVSRIFGKKPRHRSLEVLIDAARFSIKRNKKRMWFISPNAASYGSTDGKIINLSAIEEILAKLKETGMEEIFFGTFPSELRPEAISDKLLKIIKRFCKNKTISIGAQSGSERLLEKINRGHGVEEILKATEMIYKAGFLPRIDFMFGLPFETLEDRHLTIKLIDKLCQQFKAKIHAHTFMPVPGTPFWSKDPTPIDSETEKFLLKLTGKGMLDGWWLKQKKISEVIKKSL